MTPNYGQGCAPEMVEDRLAEAADTSRRLPAVKVQGYFSTRPPILRDFWEAFGWHEVEMRPGPPRPDAMDRMDEALEWLRWLDRDQVKVVWSRANNVPWKLLCWRLGVSRTTAWRTRVAALMVVAARLNERLQTSAAAL